MNTAMIKQQLHEYIEQADNAHLNAIYLLLKVEMSKSHSYDTETLAKLYKRVEADLTGNSKSYTEAEAVAIVRNKKTA